jgi:hypothetical protein
MKNALKNTCFVALLAAMLLPGCKSSKDIQKTTGAQEITLPFSGKEYQSDDKAIRAKNVGKSPDLALSKKIAMQNANSELASKIKLTIQKVMDQYTNQRSVGNVQEYENKVEEKVREIVNETLSGIKVIGEKVYQETDKSFSYWVAIEISKEDVMNAAHGKLSRDQKLQLDYDQKKFNEEFDKAMREMENQN